MLFNGDFDSPGQWSGLSDETTSPNVPPTPGRGTLHDSYTCKTGLVVTGLGGGKFARSVLKVGSGVGDQAASSRAEWVRTYDYVRYHGRKLWYTFAFMLDPDNVWDVDWTHDANNGHWHLNLGQWLGRNLCAPSLFFLSVAPPGWQGESEPVLYLFGRGGQSPALAGTTGPVPNSSEQRTGIDPAFGNGWTKMLEPRAAEIAGSQRHAQIIGPHTQQGQTLHLTPGVWWDIIVETEHYTDQALGGFTVFVRQRGETVWLKVLETPRWQKTVPWFPGPSNPQPIAASGPNNVHRIGGYT